MALSADDYRDLAHCLSRQRKALSAYKKSLGPEAPEAAQIQSGIEQLADAIGILNASAAISSLNEAQGSIEQLKAATGHMEQTLQTIGNIGKAVAIAGAALTIAAGVISGSGEGISTGIGELVSVLKPA